ETALVLNNGEEMPYHFTGHRFESAGALCLVGMGIEITERDRIERRRRVRLAVPQMLGQAKTFAEAALLLLQPIGEGLSWDLGAGWTVDGRDRSYKKAWTSIRVARR